MPVPPIVEIVERLIAEWAIPRVPSYLQRLDPPIDSKQECTAEQCRSIFQEASLPEELADFWQAYHTARFFFDRQYGGGLELVDYDSSCALTKHLFDNYAFDACRGDRIVGVFADGEQLLIRCDSDAPDFGRVLVRFAAWPRDEWYIASESLTSFLQKYGEYEGIAYWEPQEQLRYGIPP